MSPSSGPARLAAYGTALGLGLITASCLYDSTGPDALLTAGEVRLLFDDLTRRVDGPERDSTLFGTRVSAGCMSISFGDLDLEKSNDPIIAFSYRAVPEDCEARNWSGPDILYSGAPEISGDARWTRPEAVLLVFRVTGVGTFSYRTVDGRKGECGIDVAVAFQRPSTGGEDDRWVWEGTACGLSMDTTWTRADFEGAPDFSPRWELDVR